MSDVSFYPKGHMMEKLLDRVEVEWKSLGAISTLRRGRVMSKAISLKMPEITQYIALKLQIME